MVLVRQSTEPLPPWQTVWDLAISPPSCAMAMALPFKLLLPCTAARDFTLSPAAEAPMPKAVELPLGPLVVAPTPRVEALCPPTAALPALPAAALPVGVLSRAKTGPERLTIMANIAKVLIVFVIVDSFQSYGLVFRIRNTQYEIQETHLRQRPMRPQEKY